MSYRHFTRPNSTGWTTRDWAAWANDQELLLDIRTDIPEGVCSGCYGGTAKTYSDLTVSTAPDGTISFTNENRRWPRCYNCKHHEGLDGFLPISYSLSTRLESAIARAKDYREYRWLNLPLASVLNRFLRSHLACIENQWGHVDLITVVASHPSSRDGWDHMKHLVDRVRQWPVPERWVLDLLQKTSPSDANTRRGQPSEDLFLTRPDIGLAGRRVLLLDDTYTTGATLRSAGLAVIAAGGRPVAVTIGRQVKNDDFGSHIVTDAEAQRPLFHPNLCALH